MRPSAASSASRSASVLCRGGTVGGSRLDDGPDIGEVSHQILACAAFDVPANDVGIVVTPRINC
jgi:hypothetical protein